MTRHTADPDVANPTITTRSRRARPLGVIIVYAIGGLIVFPFAAQNMNIVVLSIWLTSIMTAGLVLAGLWSCYTLLFTPDVDPDLPSASRLSEAFLTLAVTLFISVVMFFAAWIATSLGSSSFLSYNVLKMWGLISYILLGSLPVVAYSLTLHAVATRRVMTSFNWFIATVVSMAVSLLAPWFWLGYKLYSNYHHM